MVKNILIVGVGGQGTLLASKIMGKVLLAQGYDVKVSEVHGMSQRGGSVVTYVRYGEKVYSPLIEKGEADLLLSFEELESARWLPYLKKDGLLITNTQQMDPMPVIMGNATYPQQLTEKLRAAGVQVCAADALAMAREAGSVRAVNMVLVGMAAQSLLPDAEVWLQTVRETVPPKTVEINEKAFLAGFAYRSAEKGA